MEGWDMNAMRFRTLLVVLMSMAFAVGALALSTQQAGVSRLDRALTITGTVCIGMMLVFAIIEPRYLLLGKLSPDDINRVGR